jgi:hypothetical protein
MTQPSGRVLGSPPHHRAYLRSSPIVCAVDTLFFLLHLALSPIIFWVPVSQAIDITIQQRYRNVEDPVDGIQYLEKQTWLRWLFFVVGTLGPAIKLAAMQGMPWTKAWGMMFLGTFVVFESIVCIKKRPINDEAAVLLGETASASVPIPESARSLVKYINYFELLMLTLALLIHTGVLAWVVVDLWALRAPTSYSDWKDPAQVTGIQTLFAVGGRVILLPMIACSARMIQFFLYINIVFEPVRRGGRWDQDRTTIAFCFPIYSLIAAEAGIVSSWMLFVLLPFSPVILLDMLLFGLAFAGPWLLNRAISWLCSIFPALSVNLLMIPETARDTWPSSRAAWTLVFIVLNLTICALWYLFRYSPAGTVNPSWTGIFG